MLYHCILRNETFPHYHAFIVAKSLDELFWSLDEYSSPYLFEIYECNNGFGFCVEVDGVGNYFAISKIQASEITTGMIFTKPNNPKFLVNKNGKLKLSTKKKGGG